jgi:8-amino-7-oxononanoate synthase
MVRYLASKDSPGRRASDALAQLGRSAPIGEAIGVPHRRHDDFWLERWMRTCADLARLQYVHPMVDAVIDEIDGRMIRIGDRWLADFASCNYLGLDLDREVIDAVPGYLEQWGTHPSWSRLLGSPVLYEQIEAGLTSLLGADDTLALPTITHIHMSVIPVLAGNGTVLMDERAHKTIYDGASAARAHGATIERFRHEDAEHLEELLLASTDTPRLICMDGVNSMTGNAPPVADFARLAREHDAILYIDDAHGFGVIGERGPDELCQYGKRGNSLIRHAGESYDNVVMVGGFSKAYSSLLAFIACPSELKGILKTAAPPYLYSGPSPIASLATVIEGLKVNDRRGDHLRYSLYRMTRRVMDCLEELGIDTPNTSGYPIVEVPLVNPDDIDEVGRFLFDHGIYVTMAAYPLVPRHEVGFRIQVTAANTDDQITHLLEALHALAGRFRMRAGMEPSAALSSGR